MMRGWIACAKARIISIASATVQAGLSPASDTTQRDVMDIEKEVHSWFETPSVA